MQTYRIMDIRSGNADLGVTTVEVPRVGKAEVAASNALGIELVRSGAPRNLAVKVYWEDEHGVTNVVRLYRKADSWRPAKPRKVFGEHSSQW